MKNTSFSLRIMLPMLGISTMLLSGCERNATNLEEYVALVKAMPGKDIPPIPEIKTYQPFDYPNHKRDPFDASAIAAQLVPENKPISHIKIDNNRSKEYLEGFPLDSLSMVGTLNLKGALWALIRTPDGTIQRAREGNYLGQNHGKIQQIGQQSVDLNEIIADGYGGYMERPASIALNSK